ncbi:hypothetical protein ACNKHM_06545 [Shigella sonnei]
MRVPFCEERRQAPRRLKQWDHRSASERTETNRLHHPEPLGGAHRNPEAMAASLKAQLLGIWPISTC